MNRIDEPGHVNNRFVNGNPETGQLPTRIGAPFLNAIQEELAAVIEGAGITLSKTDQTQLRQAIQKIVQSAVTATEHITMTQVNQAIAAALNGLDLSGDVSMTMVNQAIAAALNGLDLSGDVSMTMVNQAIADALSNLPAPVTLTEWDGGTL